MRAQPRSNGFSLLELIISLLLLGLILGSLFGAVISSQRSFTRQQTTLRSQEALRVAEMIIANVLRTARADPNDTGGGLLDPDPFNDDGVYRMVRARADFNPPDGDFDDPLEDVTVGLRNDTLLVIWQSGGAVQRLAEPVDSVLFEYFNDAGTALTTDAQVSGATKVRLTIVAAEDPLSGSAERRVSWIYLRNR